MRTPDEPVETTRVGPKRELDGEPPGWGALLPSHGRLQRPRALLNAESHRSALSALWASAFNFPFRELNAEVQR